jgi:Zn-dependent protease
MIITLIGLIIFIYSIILHEIAHGFIADRLGDPTARISKRLTLNPISHIDPVWSILFPLILVVSGSPVVFGSAKPVPIDPYNLKNPRKDIGLIALAGPATNLLIALVLSLLARLVFLMPPSIFMVSVIKVLANSAYLNIALAMFNLIPIPPLDGSRILASLLPEKSARFFDEIERFGIMIIAFLLFFPTPLFPIQTIISKTASFIFNLFFPSYPVI